MHIISVTWRLLHASQDMRIARGLVAEALTWAGKCSVAQQVSQYLEKVTSNTAQGSHPLPTSVLVTQAGTPRIGASAF